MGWFTIRLQVFKGAIGTNWLPVKFLALPTILYVSIIADDLYAQFSNSPAGETEMIFGFPSWILGIVLILCFLVYWLLEYSVALTASNVDVGFVVEPFAMSDVGLRRGGQLFNGLFVVVENLSHKTIENLRVRLVRVTIDEGNYLAPDMLLDFPRHKGKNSISVNPKDKERAFLGNHHLQNQVGTYTWGDQDYSANSSFSFDIQISSGAFPAFTKKFLLEQQGNGFGFREIIEE